MRGLYLQYQRHDSEEADSRQESQAHAAQTKVLGED